MCAHGWPTGARRSSWVSAATRYRPVTSLRSSPARWSSQATRSRLSGCGTGSAASSSSSRSRDSSAQARSSTTRSAAPRPYRPATWSSSAAVSSPARRSARGSPICASARSAAVTAQIRAPSGSTASTRSRIALSLTGSPRRPASGPLAGSSPLAVMASSSAVASRPSPVPSASRGRSPGRTHTCGPKPDLAAAASRSPATPPSVRSTTVTSPPASSRGAAIMVSSADQPASVPPATSTRSIPAGSGTAYHCRWESNAVRRACQSRNLRACDSCRAVSRRCWVSLITVTRCCSAASRARRSRRPARMTWPQRAATASAAAATTAASGRLTSPACHSASAPPSSTPAAPIATRYGRSSRPSSRRCAATQSGLTCSASGGTGRRGGGPGSGRSSAYCQPRYTRSRPWPPPGAGPLIPAARAAPRARPGSRCGPAASAPSRPARAPHRAG